MINKTKTKDLPSAERALQVDRHYRRLWEDVMKVPWNVSLEEETGSAGTETDPTDLSRSREWLFAENRAALDSYLCQGQSTTSF